MSRSEVLRHRGSYLYIRQDTLAICDNDPCAALLLDLFEFWTSCRINDVRRANEINKFMEPGKKIPVPDYWFFEKIKDLEDHIYGVYGKTKIGASLTFLKEKGFIEDKPSPIHAFLKTKLYRLMVENVQNALDLFWVKSKESNLNHKASVEQLEVTTTSDSDLRFIAESESVLSEPKTVLAEMESASHLYVLNSLNTIVSSQGNPPVPQGSRTPPPHPERETEKCEKLNTLANQQEDIEATPAQVTSSLVSPESQDPKVEATNPKLGERVSTAPRENDSHSQDAPQTDNKVATSKKPATPWKSGRKPNEKWESGFVEWHRQRLNKSDYWRNAGGAMKGDAIASLRQFEKCSEIQDKWDAYLEWLDAEQRKERDRQALQAAIAASYEIQDTSEPTPVVSQAAEQEDFHTKLKAKIQELIKQGLGKQEAVKSALAALTSSSLVAA